MKKITLFLVFISLLSTPAFSYEGRDLKKVEREISAHKKTSSELDKKVKSNDRQLKNIQDRSIKAAKSLQNNEKSINNIKEELQDLTGSIKIKGMELEKNKDKYDAVLSSLIRMSSIPSDGFVISSDNPQELINTRVLLNSAIPHLKNKAQKLQTDINEIENSKISILNKKEELTKLNSTAKKKMKEIESLLKDKNKLKSKLTKQQKQEAREIKKLAKQASSIKDLINKLQLRKVKSKPGVKPTTPIKKIVIPPSKPKFIKNEGKLPIVGRIILGYGRKNAQDITNHGWEIEGNANGLVTCPISGEVLYSGVFGGYNNIIVFDNGGGYNVLLAGMERIGVDVGDSVKSGEPVGFLKANPAKLYLEVRKNGNPIDPVKLIR